MTKLINQGGFGFIFYPAFNCNTKFKKKSKQLISKLQLKSFNSQNEIYIGSLIQKIINYRFYFLPVIYSCNLSLGTIDSSIFDKYKIIKNNINKYKVLELPYLEYLDWDTLFGDSKRTTQHFFLTYIETYKYVVIGIQELLKSSIVHFDIKKQNILYDKKTENPILIDFGLSIPFNKLSNRNLKEYFYIYAPDYTIWPLEVHIINYILHKGTLTKQAIDTTIIKYMENNNIFIGFSHEFKSKFIITASNFFYKFINLKSSDIINKLLQYYNTWDIYSLSIMYIKLLNKLFKKGYFKNSFLISFSELIVENISPIPGNRLTPNDVLEKYINIFFIKATPGDYSILIKQLDS